MKLLDILVRDLKEWPEGAVIAVQDNDGEVKFSERSTVRNSVPSSVWLRDGKVGFGSKYMEKADDRATAIIHRHEYDQAVSQAIQRPVDMIRPAEWDRKGLPLVGTDLELNVYGTWERAKAIAHDDGKVIFRFRGNEYGCAEPDAFRPLEFSRLKAERAEAVEEMMELFKLADTVKRDFLRVICFALYDAGYRKQEVSK